MKKVIRFILGCRVLEQWDVFACFGGKKKQDHHSSVSLLALRCSVCYFVS